VDGHHAFAGGPAFAAPSAVADALGRIGTALQRRPGAAAAWRSFTGAATVGDRCLLGPNARCFNDGPSDRVRVGARVVCRGVLRRETFGDGTLVIGDDVYIGDDTIVSCCDRIEIGAQTLIGHGVNIFDNNSHPVAAAARAADWLSIVENRPRDSATIAHAPVRIGEAAWIGFGSVVLKGVTIGDGAVVAAASVVTTDVSPRTVVAGNPARPVGEA